MKIMRTSELIASWRERAREYDKRDREATGRKEYVIAAQQAGLSCALFLAANELEAAITYTQEFELRQSREAGPARANAGKHLKHRA
jgi:hypothetical protein